jgi:hypothetical protein
MMEKFLHEQHSVTYKDKRIDLAHVPNDIAIEVSHLNRFRTSMVTVSCNALKLANENVCSLMLSRKFLVHFLRAASTCGRQ